MSEQTQTPEAPATRRFTVTVHELKTYATKHTVTVELPSDSPLDAKALEGILRGPGDDQDQPVGSLFDRNDDGEVCAPDWDVEVGGVALAVADVTAGESERIPIEGTTMVVQSVAEVKA